jgi:hypothetical protein
MVNGLQQLDEAHANVGANYNDVSGVCTQYVAGTEGPARSDARSKTHESGACAWLIDW